MGQRYPVPITLALWPWPLLIIAFVALAVIAPFFLRGNPSGHDFEFHLNSWIEVNQQWRDGVIYPRWAEFANYAYGEPRFIFYPPLSWLLGAFLGAVLPWKAAPGAFLWLALVLAGCSMFLLARHWLGARDAVFAAALYAANPYHLVIIYWRSAFGEILTAPVLPLLLLFIMRLDDAQESGKAGKTNSTAVLALLISSVWLADAPAGVMVNYSFVLLLLAAALVRRSLSTLAYGALALAAGSGLSAFYLLPATYEQKWVDIFQAISEGVRPQDNFLFTQSHNPLQHQFNLVVSLVAIVQVILLAVALLWWRELRRRLPRAWWMLALWSGIAALLMFPISSFAWNHLPKLLFIQFPWRWLLCMNVGFALLLAVACRRWAARAALVAVVLAVVIFAAHRILPPWWDTAGDVAELQDNIESGTGYEGTDEYLPINADAEKIDQTARRVTYRGNGTDRIHVFEWEPEVKTFSAVVTAPGTLMLRLFNYPAWKVTVNGRAAGTEAENATGQMMIPVETGENRVQVTFARTSDRTIGGWLSLATLALLVGWVISEQKRRRIRPVRV